jgi:hypothetical protein
MLSFPLCPLLAASATVALTRFGFHAVTLSNSDILELNLDDRFAVFPMSFRMLSVAKAKRPTLPLRLFFGVKP